VDKLSNESLSNFRKWRIMVKDKIIKFLDNIENYFIGYGLLIMTVITFVNVISRKFLHLSLSFTEEITTILFIFISLLGAAVAAKRGNHLGLSVFSDLVPARHQKYVSLITWFVASFFSFYLIKYGLAMVKSEYIFQVKTPSLGWPEWIFGLAIPIGGLFIFIRFTQFTINVFRKAKEEK